MPSEISVSGNAAIVNGEPITNEDLVREYMKDGGQPALGDLIDAKLVDQAAAKAHVTVTPAEVDARIKQEKQQVMSQIWMRQPGVTWAQFLTAQGRSEYYVRQKVRTIVLLEKIVAKNLPPVSLAGKTHVYHILLLTIPMPGHDKPHTDADALAKIKQIRSDIESGKITFEAAAKKYSEDEASALKGGDLGWLGSTDSLDPDFMKGMLALKEGQVSDPVKSRFGYHLIYAARSGNHATPAEIKQVTDSQMEGRVGQLIQPYLEQLRSSAKIQNLLMPGVPMPPPPGTPKPMTMTPYHAKPGPSTPPKSGNK